MIPKGAIERYLKKCGYEITLERRTMISIIEAQDSFNMESFVKEAARNHVSKFTAYRFKNILLECKILVPPVIDFLKFNNNEIEIEEAIANADVRIKAKAPQVLSRIQRSYQ